MSSSPQRDLQPHLRSQSSCQCVSIYLCLTVCISTCAPSSIECDFFIILSQKLIIEEKLNKCFVDWTKRWSVRHYYHYYYICFSFMTLEFYKYSFKPSFSLYIFIMFDNNQFPWSFWRAVNNSGICYSVVFK